MFRPIMVIILLVALFPVGSNATEAVIEDLLKKNETSNTSSPFTSQVPIAQIAPTTPLLPKTEQPKIFKPEKIKLGTEETTPQLLKGVTVKSGKETTRRSDGREMSDAEEPLLKEKTVPSEIEKLVSADEIVEASEVVDDKSTTALTQFGYNFFQNLTLLPQMDVQVSSDYMVGPGDSIVVTVWGSIEGSYELIVSNGGEVILPKVGPIKVAGLPFGKLPGVFNMHLAKIFRDFDLAVNMGKLRSNRISVIGEVASPGDYTISSLSTVLNALSAAGGPTKNGSLRNITIRRTGNAEETIDLYDFFLTGDKRKDVRLSSGDTIFVPVIGRIAAVAGKVKRPAIYELKNETTLKELIALAEGVTATGYLQRVQISRVIANEKKQVIDLNLDPTVTGKTFDVVAAGIPIQDMDIVKVFPINSLLHNHFKLEGHVERPGFYALKPGIKISSVLNHQLLLPEYAPIIEITRLYPPNLEPRKIMLDLEKALTGVPGQDIEIKEFDTIKLFSKWKLQEKQLLRVSGEVQKPGVYPLLNGMTVRDLLLQAGNPNASAYLKSAEISRLKIREEKAQLQPIVINLEEALKGNPKHNILLEPFDELTVRRIPNWAEAKDRYVTLSGEFVFPGVYPIYKGERLSSVIKRAGGFSEKAYPKGAKFTRELVRVQQQQRMDEVLERAEGEILTKQTASMSVASSKEEIDATKAALDGLQRTIALLRTKKAEGRMIIALSTPEWLAGTPADVELAGGDVLTIPPDPGSINVLGHVYNPSAALFEQGHDVRYYLDRVGGATNSGEEDDMYLVKVDGTVYSKKQSSSFLFYDGFLSREIDSGDTIVVPQKIERVAWLRDIKDITTILANLAISAGTVLLGLK
ncbi:MAG: SLBB domain-containing protein [Desulfuromonadaceae bacterium]|nr:SLBB domain-containing protein [Desulfuromonadaceae bacterium]